MPISDSPPILRGAKQEVSVNTQVMQFGPGLFKIVCVTSDGSFLGSIDLAAVNPDAINVLAQSLNRFAATQGNQLVRANGPLPPLDFGKA